MSPRWVFSSVPFREPFSAEGSFREKRDFINAKWTAGPRPPAPFGPSPASSRPPTPSAQTSRRGAAAAPHPGPPRLPEARPTRSTRLPVLSPRSQGARHRWAQGPPCIHSPRQLLLEAPTQDRACVMRSDQGRGMCWARRTVWLGGFSERSLHPSEPSPPPTRPQGPASGQGSAPNSSGMKA